MQKKNIIILAVAMLLLGGIAGYLSFRSVAGAVFQVSETQYVYIDTDDDLDSVRAKVLAVGNPSTMTGFDLISKAYKLSKWIHTGRYAIHPSTTARELVINIRRHDQAAVNLVVPSVRTVNDMAGRLSTMLALDSADIAAALNDSITLANYGYTPATAPCLFIPNTYQVNWDISVGGLLDRMQKEKENFWTISRQKQAQKQGLTPDEAVTLASIVASETSNEPEMPTIAGLYLNRLHQDILLQSDPTVIFALQDFTIRRVLNTHLEYDSPYNTYRYKGLPPGPIRIPSVAAIQSVLNPQQHDYLFMCAKEDFSGTHNFARTNAEHLENARRYINALNARGIK